MKNTLIDRRIKELEKELAAVHGSIKTLVKHPPKPRAVEPAKATNEAPPVVIAEPPPAPSRPVTPIYPQSTGAPAARPAAPAPVPRPDLAGFDGNSRGRDERFVDYLASSLGPAQPLRRERNAERNRALVAIGFALILIFWIVSRFLFL